MMNSGLRAPNLQELIAADKFIYEEVYKLVNEERWTMGDALHEIASVRVDLHTWMMPSARTSSMQPTKGSPGRQSYRDSGKGRQQSLPAPPEQLSLMPPPPPNRSKGEGRGRQGRSAGGRDDRSRSAARQP